MSKALTKRAKRTLWLNRDNDLPGMLALTKAVHEGEWPHTVDAVVWAEKFLKRFKPNNRPNSFPDKADMIGWFANAIMAGYDRASSRRRKT